MLRTDEDDVLHLSTTQSHLLSSLALSSPPPARDRASLPKKLAEMTSENERLKAELSNLAAKSEDDSEALRKSLIKQTNEYEGKIKDLR